MYRVLVIGGGSIGERHVRCFQKTGSADVSLCEVRDDVRQRVAGTYSLASTFTSFDDALCEPFDIAVVCTPAHLHIDMARQLAERGIHLLIEKPLSIALDGLDELMAAVDSRQLVASVAYVYRTHPALREMRDAIQQGRFGRPVQVVVTSGQHFPLYRPAYREIYYTRRETGGGAVQDALTHPINAVEWLVGPVTRVAADIEHCVLEGVSVEDTVHVITRHAQVLGTFSLNQHQAPNESTLTVICERGTVRFEMHQHRWMTCVEPGGAWQIESQFSLERDDLFIQQARDFINTVDGRQPPACPLPDALQTLRVNLAILQAAEEQRWVQIQQNPCGDR